MSIKHPILAHLRHFSSLYTNLRSTTVERALQIRPFYAKQTQFSGLLNDVNSVYTKDYKENRRKEVMKKQTQFKPNQSQFQMLPCKNGQSRTSTVEVISLECIINEYGKILSRVVEISIIY
jgi:hypothetical protein